MVTSRTVHFPRCFVQLYQQEASSHLPISQATMGRLSFSWLKAQYFHLATISAFLSTWGGEYTHSSPFIKGENNNFTFVMKLSIVRPLLNQLASPRLNA